ncbi:MAG: hypothetical protein IJ053_06895 [Lachnospiraceae bacterium]|nr:hypothetical protein [Lachnospiraceae bacterium]
MLKNRKKFNNTILIPLLILALCILMSGCGKKEKVNYIGEVKENTFNLNEDKTIREIACQDFSGTSYDISGLSDSIKSDIDKYAQGDKKDSVKLLEYKEEDGLVRVAIDYGSLDDYNAFNGTSYADNQDYMAYGNELMKDMSGNEINLFDINFATGEYKIFSADGEFNLNLNGQIAYYNSHAKLNSNSSAKLDGLGNAIIIYK